MWEMSLIISANVISCYRMKKINKDVTEQTNIYFGLKTIDIVSANMIIVKEWENNNRNSPESLFSGCLASWHAFQEEFRANYCNVSGHKQPWQRKSSPFQIPKFNHPVDEKAWIVTKTWVRSIAVFGQVLKANNCISSAHA